jgi:hypothetical protein
MIVIGLDVHKQSVTAVAVDEAGRPLEENWGSRLATYFRRTRTMMCSLKFVPSSWNP